MRDLIEDIIRHGDAEAASGKATVRRNEETDLVRYEHEDGTVQAVRGRSSFTTYTDDPHGLMSYAEWANDLTETLAVADWLRPLGYALALADDGSVIGMTHVSLDRLPRGVAEQLKTDAARAIGEAVSRAMARQKPDRRTD